VVVEPLVLGDFPPVPLGALLAEALLAEALLRLCLAPLAGLRVPLV